MSQIGDHDYVVDVDDGIFTTKRSEPIQAAGEVIVTMADGSKQTRPAYSKKQLRDIKSIQYRSITPRIDGHKTERETKERREEILKRASRNASLSRWGHE